MGIWIIRHLRGPESREHITHLWHLADGSLDGVLHRHGLVDADSGQANRLDEDVLLVEGGQDLSAEPRGKNAAQDDEGGGRSENQSRMSKGPTQHRQIGMPNTPDQWTFDLRQATTEEQRGHGRDEGEGQKQGTGQPSTMPLAAISIDSGITSATMSAAIQFPRSPNSTATTSNAPSSRFFRTVSIVASTRCVRS